MTMLSDTALAIERRRIAGLRRMSAARKLALVGEMNRSVRTLALAGLRERYPDDSEARLRRRLADLLLGPELAARAYGPAGEDEDAD